LESTTSLLKMADFTANCIIASLMLEIRIGGKHERD
jgi:hypothetical protein